MKKYITFMLALLMVLSLCACGQETESVPQNNTVAQNDSASNEVNTMPPTDAPKASAIAVNFGDVIENENLLMTIETAEIKEELKYQKSSNFSTSLHIDEGKQAFCLIGTIENIGGNEINEWAFAGKLVVDDKYNYDVRMWCPNDLEPLTEGPFYLYAEIPDKLVDSYSTATFTFGFNNDFESGFGDVEDLENLFTITVTK